MNENNIESVETVEQASVQGELLPRRGRKPKLRPDQLADLARMVEAGEVHRKIPQIAATLGCSVSTIKRALAKVRR